MLNILEQYEHIAVTEDVFSFWKQELELRKELRQRVLSPVKLEYNEQVDLLYRSLYFAKRKFDFFQILFPNLGYMPVLEWLVNAPAYVMQEFLRFLPWYILNNRVLPVDLEFVARLYKEDYRSFFIAIINVLDQESCSYLISRTANADLRSLLKDKLDSFNRLRLEFFYGLGDTRGKGDYPTFYGDKVCLIRDTLKMLEDSSAHNFQEPFQLERFLMQIKVARYLFKCGLVEDSLVFLAETYSDYQQKNRLVEVFKDQKIYKSFSQLLRAVIPMYGVIYQPLQAYSYARQIYDEYFPLISPDVSSLRYLQLWEVITRGFQSDAPGIFTELFYTLKSIAALRPAVLPLPEDEEMKNGLSEAWLKEILASASQVVKALPHETFVIMELLRLLKCMGRVNLKGEEASCLLRTYIQLWKWIPCRLFINEDLVMQIAPLVDHPTRYEAQRAVEFMNTMNDDEIKHELAYRSQLFKKPDNMRRDILIGKLLGAL